MTDDRELAHTAKVRVRSQISRAIQALPRADAERWSSMICMRLTTLPAWRTCRDVLVYRSMPGEVDTAAIIASALREGKRAFLPRINGESLGFHQYTGGRLLRHPYGMMEPPEEAPRWDRRHGPQQPTDDVLSEGAVLICPGIAFDTSGRRLGRGRGFYDRFIAEFRGMRAASPDAVDELPADGTESLTVLGVCFDLQLVDSVPTGPDDQLMDLVVTESRTVNASRDRPTGVPPQFADP